MHIYQGTPSPIDHRSMKYHTPNTFNIQQNAHIPRADGPPSNQPLMYGILLYKISFTDSSIHIYQGPPQLTIDLWNTTTPNKLNIWQNAHILRADVSASNQPQMDGIPLHQIIFKHSRIHIYLGHMYPFQLTIDVWNTTTWNMFHIQHNAHILRADVPPTPIDHRCMEYYYTQHVSHIAQCTYTQGRCTPSNCPYRYGILLHHISFTDSRMHIYQGTPSPINHKSMKYHTPNTFNIQQNAHIPRADGPPSN